MITFGIIIASLAMYFVIGFIAARAFRPRILRQCTYRVGDPYVNYWGQRSIHEEDGIEGDWVHHRTWQLVLGWPIFTWVLAIKYNLNDAIDEANPYLQKRKIEEQERRIAELEEELMR